uniref:RBR-type E3 ubiquitin transferase n=1 Tax=Leersia perrieri TaxID=77586 RepID=A0A0D9W8U9_9ORYZ
MLDTMWSQQFGLEVVYEWVQWLQSSALSHLGFDDGIVIQQPDSMMGPVDVRAVSEIAPVESVLQWLISYNDEQCHEYFLIGLHDCMICFTENAGTDFIKLPCGHFYCQRCMETYSRMHVTEGTVLKLLCPNDKCGGVIPPSLLKRLLGDTDFERWERLILQKTLDSMLDIAYCPRCGTGCLEDEENSTQCSKCFFSFCTCCRDRRHIGEKCITPEEKLLSLQDHKKVHQLSKGNLARRINLANEISSIKEVLRSSVLCPKCSTAISRVDGCNHMLCRNCRQPFCYDCGKSLNPGHSRIHKENLARETMKVNASNFIKEVKKEPAEQRSKQHPCPNCRQLNPKIGNNNHMFFWACQVHYCALCRRMLVRKSSEHYGPRGCKQHSVDHEITQTQDKQLGNFPLAKHRYGLAPLFFHPDNMLALEAIYGDNIGIFSAKDGLRCFQVHVHCEIPDGISVSAEVSQGDNHDQNSRFFNTFSVQHLAPISLTCLMPPSYPSHHAPYFTLSSQWLDTAKLSSLCLMLDAIWTQQIGLEVVYEWVQWLQSSALSHLDFEDGIVVRQPDSMMDPVDVRAVAEIVFVESVFQWLISYNEEQCHESFLSGLHNCMICFTEYAGIDFITLPCRHYFCRRCMGTYSRIHVAEGTVLKLLCPYDKCGGVIPPNLLKRLLGDAEFERWERLILQKTLDSMSDVAYCPRCGTACLEDEENNAQCSKCFFSFCTRCRKCRHKGEKCRTPEEQLEIKLQRNLIPCRIDQENWATNNPSALIKEAKKELKGNSQGSIRAQIVGNNNHMFCWACQVHYCALCRMVVRKSSEHYGPRGCKQHSIDPEIPIFKTNKNDDSGSEDF